MRGKEIVWNGEANRKLRITRPCDCGCDNRGGKSGVGYLTGSDASGDGFSIWIESEVVYQRLEKALKGEN